MTTCLSWLPRYATCSARVPRFEEQPTHHRGTVGCVSHPITRQNLVVSEWGYQVLRSRAHTIKSHFLARCIVPSTSLYSQISSPYLRSSDVEYNSRVVDLPAAFMRHSVAVLRGFPASWTQVERTRRQTGGARGKERWRAARVVWWVAHNRMRRDLSAHLIYVLVCLIFGNFVEFSLFWVENWAAWRFLVPVVRSAASCLFHDARTLPVGGIARTAKGVLAGELSICRVHSLNNGTLVSDIFSLPMYSISLLPNFFHSGVPSVPRNVRVIVNFQVAPSFNCGIFKTRITFFPLRLNLSQRKFRFSCFPSFQPERPFLKYSKKGEQKGSWKLPQGGTFLEDHTITAGLFYHPRTSKVTECQVNSLVKMSKKIFRQVKSKRIDWTGWF